MEAVFYSALSGAGAGGVTVFFFVLLQGQKIKEELRKEFYRGMEKTEHECKEYTDSKHDDIKEVLTEIKGMIKNIQATLMNK